MTNDKAFPFHPFLQTRDGKKKFFPKIIGGCEAPGLRMIVTEKSTRFEVFEEKVVTTIRNHGIQRQEGTAFHGGEIGDKVGSCTIHLYSVLMTKKEADL